MSDNPFEKPQEPQPPLKATAPIQSPSMAPVSPKKAMPGLMMAVAIICLILGLGGIGSSCMAGLFIGGQSFFMSLMDNLPPDTPNLAETKAIAEIGMQAQNSMMIPAIISIVLSLIVAIMLIAGGIGALQRKSSGRNLLSTALLATIFYSLIKIGIGIYGHFHSKAFVQNAVENYEGPADAEVVKKMMEGSAWQSDLATIGMMAVAVFMLLFYCWAKYYVGTEKIKQFYDAV